MMMSLPSPEPSHIGGERNDENQPVRERSPPTLGGEVTPQRRRRIYTRWDIGTRPSNLEVKPEVKHVPAPLTFDVDSPAQATRMGELTRMDPSLGREIASWDPAKEAFSSWLKGFNLLTMGSRLSDQGKIALMVRKFPRGRQLQLKLVVERYSKPTFLEVVEALRRELEGADVGDWKARLGQLVDSQRPDEPARALWTRVIDAASQMACDPTEDGLLQVSSVSFVLHFPRQLQTETYQLPVRLQAFWMRALRLSSCVGGWLSRRRR